MLRHKDALGIFNQNLSKQIGKLADQLKLPFFYADEHITDKNETRRLKGEYEIGLGITELGQLIKHTEGRH